MKKFYSHLIEIESVTIELDSMDLADHEKHQLAGLVDSNMHNVVMDAILSKLSDEDKRKFAEISHSDNHQAVWEFLKDKSSDIESEIKKAAADFKAELHKDLKEAKTKNA